jgi:hypothetical protein
MSLRSPLEIIVMSSGGVLGRIDAQLLDCELLEPGFTGPITNSWRVVAPIGHQHRSMYLVNSHISQQ